MSKEPDRIPCGIPYRCIVPKAAECTNLPGPTFPSSGYVAYGAHRIDFTFMNATAAVMAMDAGAPASSMNDDKLRERWHAYQQVLNVSSDE